jgi:hypothetical protein
VFFSRRFGIFYQEKSGNPDGFKISAAKKATSPRKQSVFSGFVTKDIKLEVHDGVARWHICFQTKNSNLGKFRRVSQWNMLVYSTAIRYILCPFGIFCGLLVYLMALWYISWPFGIFLGHVVYFVAIWYIFSVLVSCTKKNLASRYKQKYIFVFFPMDSFFARSSSVSVENMQFVLGNANVTNRLTETDLSPGVDVMITIFCDFCQFSAKKLTFFSKTNVMIKFLHNLALF